MYINEIIIVIIIIIFMHILKRIYKIHYSEYLFLSRLTNCMKQCWILPNINVPYIRCSQNVCMGLCMHACIHTFMHTYTYIFIFTYSHICAFTYQRNFITLHLKICSHFTGAFCNIITPLSAFIVYVSTHVHL